VKNAIDGQVFWVAGQPRVSKGSGQTPKSNT
jgi:hypothetical protein